jgi:large subunit ribosomal protein L34e
MPRGMFKSGRLRKISVRTPGSRVAVHYRQRKPSKALCGLCKTQLSGVARALPSKMKNMPKSAKRPERPYGGMFCSACTRRLLQQQARGASQ